MKKLAATKKVLLALLLTPCISHATSIMFNCPGERSRFDGHEELSEPIYFKSESNSPEFSSVEAHIPIPKRFKSAKVESASIIFFVPSVTKAPLGWTTPQYKIENKEVIIQFGGIPKTELEARVRVTFIGKHVDVCESHLVATYRFIDGTKGFRSVFDTDDEPTDPASPKAAETK